MHCGRKTSELEILFEREIRISNERVESHLRTRHSTDEKVMRGGMTARDTEIRQQGEENEN
jgi:hypothetical protein